MPVIGETDELACPTGVKRNLVFRNQLSVSHKFWNWGKIEFISALHQNRHFDDTLQKSIKKPIRYFLIIRTFYRYGNLYGFDF